MSGDLNLSDEVPSMDLKGTETVGDGQQQIGSIIESLDKRRS